MIQEFIVKIDFDYRPIKSPIMTDEREMPH